MFHLFRCIIGISSPVTTGYKINDVLWSRHKYKNAVKRCGIKPHEAPCYYAFTHTHTHHTHTTHTHNTLTRTNTLIHIYMKSRCYLKSNIRRWSTNFNTASPLFTNNLQQQFYPTIWDAFPHNFWTKHRSLNPFIERVLLWIIDKFRKQLIKTRKTS